VELQLIRTVSGDTVDGAASAAKGCEEMESIDPATTIGTVNLTIADLDRSVKFYERHLGFQCLRRTERTASLGAGSTELLALSQCESAPRMRRATGLYHFAILVPSRVELARSLRRLVEAETLLQGFADHGVSESVYLGDPDGNGIEIYRDRPRSEWPLVAGQLQMRVDPLDVDKVLTELVGKDESAAGLADGTTIGHIHLHVARLADAEAFYAGILGFDLIQRFGDSALFLSAGGYHHHIGLNTWAGVGAPPPPPGAIGLRHFVVRVPDEQALGGLVARITAAGIPIEDHGGGLLIRDPSANAMVLVAQR
jgi:catechol 2,3-dioxygenase